jgi:hypothetical protein
MHFFLLLLLLLRGIFPVALREMNPIYISPHWIKTYNWSIIFLVLALPLVRFLGLYWGFCRGIAVVL